MTDFFVAVSPPLTLSMLMLRFALLVSVRFKAPELCVVGVFAVDLELRNCAVKSEIL